MRMSLAVSAVIVVTLLGTSPSEAYYNGRWCATVFNGEGSVREICHFNSFDACQAEVIAGNRGTCGPNPYFTGQQDSPKSRKRQRQ